MRLWKFRSSHLKLFENTDYNQKDYSKVLLTALNKTTTINKQNDRWIKPNYVLSSWIDSKIKQKYFCRVSDLTSTELLMTRDLTHEWDLIPTLFQYFNLSANRLDTISSW